MQSSIYIIIYEIEHSPRPGRMTSIVGIKSVLKKYPRLTRVGLVVVFALTADQVVGHEAYGTGSDESGLTNSVYAQENSTQTAGVTEFESFVESKDEQESRLLESVVDIIEADSEVVADEEDVRSQTVYP